MHTRFSHHAWINAKITDTRTSARRARGIARHTTDTQLAEVGQDMAAELEAYAARWEKHLAEQSG
ncbi:MAG TPA: hypothetical protein VFE65_19350 [Pseudonocardia sp.]|nr:hypothetical protein [Pseudonocardia sp.]